MNASDSVLQRANPPLERFIPNPKLRFMEQCREVMREADAFSRRSGKNIVLFTVQDILEEQLARKLA